MQVTDKNCSGVPFCQLLLLGDFGVNYKTLTSQLTDGTSGSKVYNGKKPKDLLGENIEESLATDFGP
jgi:hypothetical protein